MPFGRPRPLNEYTNREIIGYLVVGTVICLVILIASFGQPDLGYLAWLPRGFVVLWFVDGYYTALGELRRRRCKHIAGGPDAEP